MHTHRRVHLDNWDNSCLWPCKCLAKLAKFVKPVYPMKVSFLCQILSAIIIVQVPGLPVYGVAIPTVSGLRLVLNAVSYSKGVISLPFCCLIISLHFPEADQGLRLQLATQCLVCCAASSTAKHMRKCIPPLGSAEGADNGAPLVTFIGVRSAGKRKVLWHNMREEPVLYINGKPYVVRESNKPFANLEYTGKASLFRF